MKLTTTPICYFENFSESWVIQELKDNSERLMDLAVKDHWFETEARFLYLGLLDLC